MDKYRRHRDGCPFRFAPLDTCDCVERNMLDEINSLRADVAFLEAQVAAYEDMAPKPSPNALRERLAEIRAMRGK